MPVASRFSTSRALVIVALVSAAALSSSGTVTGQSEQWTSPYSMILTPQRAMALVRAADRKLNYVPGEVLIKFKPGVTASGQQRALMALRSRPTVSQLKWIGQVARLRDESELDSTILAAQLRIQPEVAYAEPNYLSRTSGTPNDPGFAAYQWNLKALDMPRAWDINAGGRDTITVAVVDTGITSTSQNFTFPTWDGFTIRNTSVPFRINPDLSVTRLVSPRDFVFWTGPVLDMVGHGTHVAATVGEDTDNGIGEAGIAYNVKIMPVKVCLGFWDVQFTLSAGGFQGFAPLDVGGCADDDVAEGIRYAADNGAKVINLSLGGEGASQTLKDALTYATGKGAFVAIAAGNEFEEGNAVEYPAGFASSMDGVMAVGAVGPSLTRAFYSNTGSHLEISAPGGNSREGGASAVIWQTTIFEDDFDAETVVFPRFDRYIDTPFQGTSMAAPHVAGIAALILKQGVTKPAAIEALIKATARDLGPRGRDDEYGAGLIQPRPALLGFGFAR